MVLEMNYIGNTIEILFIASAAIAAATIDLIIARYIVTRGEFSTEILKKSSGFITLFFIILIIKTVI